ncbi:hypothetical protein RJ640_010796 [Escallonia rubra]|uniref:Uncharacterized protein n=1 Tax=Escallonia rubra TaxID=112253 RepID=A0AA88RR06_9ASTE|nr:hypothetical protein RJ640_010796 [Escallonia rubra]
MAVGVEKESVEIIKPRNDKREYRRIVLQNSLQALLISDPDTDKLVQAPQSLNVIAPGELMLQQGKSKLWILVSIAKQQLIT